MTHILSSCSLTEPCWDVCSVLFLSNKHLFLCAEPLLFDAAISVQIIASQFFLSVVHY